MSIRLEMFDLSHQIACHSADQTLRYRSMNSILVLRLAAMTRDATTVAPEADLPMSLYEILWVSSTATGSTGSLQLRHSTMKISAPVALCSRLERHIALIIDDQAATHSNIRSIGQILATCLRIGQRGVMQDLVARMLHCTCDARAICASDT